MDHTLVPSNVTTDSALAAYVASIAHDQAGGVVIPFNSTDILTLSGVSLAQLSNDFHLI